MKKRITALGLAIFTLMLTGCGESASSSENSVNGEVSSEVSDVTPVNSSDESQEEISTEESTPVEERAYGFCYSMALPDGYVDSRISSAGVYKKETESGGVYLQHCCDNDTSSSEIQALTLDDTFEYFGSLRLTNVNKVYGLDRNYIDSVFTCESEEDFTAMGSDAKIISGKIVPDNDTDPQLAYTACCAMVKLKVNEADVPVPFCWLAFGEDTEENRVEALNAVKLFAGSAVEN